MKGNEDNSLASRHPQKEMLKEFFQIKRKWHQREIWNMRNENITTEIKSG